MDAATENRLRLEQMESYGRILAGFSHDMRNHLAVIQESGGLLEDLLAMERQGENNPLSEQFRQTIRLIDERVRTSAALCRHLSGLAHRSDLPLSSFDLNELISELTVFLERPAGLRRVEVQLHPGQGIHPLHRDPALLQHVVYRLSVFCLELLEQGETLRISTAQEQDFCTVNFHLSGAAQVNLAALSDTIPAAVGKLAGTLEERTASAAGEPDSAGIRLMLRNVLPD